MPKYIPLGLIVLISLLALGACPTDISPSSAASLGPRTVWANEDREQADEIITEGNKLTYIDRKGNKGEVTGLRLPKEEELGAVQKQTIGAVNTNEAIKDWIVKEEYNTVRVYALFFGPINEDLYNKTGEIEFDEVKLKIFAPELRADMKATGKLIYVQ